ncbi:putative phospholipid hydroperoxide glutathione peroxidase [Schistosoma japonicum]|nr:putative phospholipid hydroperoxide glutathione peroxidase [Schistosoma japonicum]
MIDCFTRGLLLTLICLGGLKTCNKTPALNNIYHFNVTDIDGNEVQLTKYFGLRILAFPCNQFRGQEPGTDQEIKQRVLAKYNVTFDLFHKIDVNGENAIPLYKFLKQSTSSWFFRDIEWNFVKFLVDKSGNPVSRYSSITPPNSMEAEIRKLLDVSSK